MFRVGWYFFCLTENFCADYRISIWGRNNSRSMDMTSQILPFIRSDLSVITEMTGHFFLEQL